MKKSLIVVGGSVVALAVGIFVYSTSANATASPQQEVTQVVNHYLEDLKSGNVQDAVHYVHDYRFNDQADTLAGYKQIAQTDPILDYSIVKVTPQSSTSAAVTISITTKSVGTQQVTFPVNKEGENWGIVIQNVKGFKYQGGGK